MSNTVVERKTKKHSAEPGNLSKIGVVNFFVRSGAGEMKGQVKEAGINASKIIEVIQGGLSVRELVVLQGILGLPMERLAPKLGISRATLNRRMAKGRLEPQESDRLVRFARLMGKATEVFETEGKARVWLNSPQIGLGGAVPLDYAQTEVGAREVEDLLGRIEYGVYS